MLPSVRRVVTSAPQRGLAPLIASAPKAASVFTRGHQRRCSSSKPSNPADNGSSDIAAGRTVPASSASTRADGKAAGEKRKRKNKDERNTSFKKLPSVPSTHHLSHEALGLSSFFSLHRPISISQTMPRSVTDEHFASIFAGRTKAGRVNDTMTTLSSTIDQLEEPMAQVTIGGDQDSQGDLVHKLQLKNADGSQSSVYLQVDAMSGDFLPFRPPPLPQVQAAGEPERRVAEADAPTDDMGGHRVYNAMFTIEESTEPDGQIRIVAHSPRILDDEPSRSYLERLSQRRLRLDSARANRGMHAISVKRIRKLKMKKKKYKKLQKRTRNERRKLDRV